MITWTPSPVIVQIGPIGIPWYGVGYAIAIAVGVWLAGVEARRKGLDTSIIADGLLWVVVAGIIGARLYHVIDQWQRYQNDLLAIVLPPYSGLGIYGGIAGGLVGLFLYSRRRGFPFLPWVDVLVPSLFIGQAIARWGNFFNQELYGPPTDLPWGIAIECVHRVAAYPCSQFPFETTGFVPLFFYEATLSLIGGLLALWIGRRFVDELLPGDLLSFWLVWYGVVRAYLETYRAGWNWAVDGFPVATAVSITIIVIGVATFVWRHRRREDVDLPPPRGVDTQAGDVAAPLPMTIDTAAAPPVDADSDPVVDADAPPSPPAPSERPAA
ncbi:MAG TPA: prolipoprotein diacylglyceryl transferase [Candidatus Saccharimonadia bacterium]|nr:prolipoprotein diacylglyceryl transferase [Candidatus Saccharimonadia bacterium]